MEWKSLKYYRKDLGTVEEFPDIELTITGDFRYSKNKNKINILTLNQVYPTIRFYVKDKPIRKLVHVAILSTFSNTVPKEKGMTVDHIDRDKFNYNIDNLRFVSLSENLKNRKINLRNILYFILNKDLGIEKEFIYTKSTDKRNYSKLVNTLNRYKLQLQEMISISMTEDVLDLFNIDELISLVMKDKDCWKSLISEDYQISKHGLIKRKTKFGYHLTRGTLDSRNYYVSGVKFNSSYYVHNIMAQLFLNSGNRLLDDQVVDHINTVTTDNHIDNLRIVTQSENIKNSMTLDKLSIIIKCSNFDKTVYFKSQADCSRILEVSVGSINDWVMGRYRCTIFGLSNFEKVLKEELKPGTSFITSIDQLRLYSFDKLSDVNKLLTDFKIKKYSDFKKNNLEFVYKRIRKHGWLKDIQYYKEE